MLDLNGYFIAFLFEPGTVSTTRAASTCQDVTVRVGCGRDELDRSALLGGSVPSPRCPEHRRKIQYRILHHGAPYSYGEDSTNSALQPLASLAEGVQLSLCDRPRRECLLVKRHWSAIHGLSGLGATCADFIDLWQLGRSGTASSIVAIGTPSESAQYLCKV